MNIISLAFMAVLTTVITSLSFTSVQAAAPSVVTSVKPLHAIVSAVMDGIAQPRLLVKGGASPHDYAMRPSDAAALNDAELIVWVGAGFEIFLKKPLDALSDGASIVTLMNLADAEGDPHIWLDPANALRIAEQVAAALIIIDPHNRTRYDANVAGFSDQLDLLDAEIRTTLAPVIDLPYLVFHDAYGYFERRYGLAQVGAITINPQRKPGAKRIAALREIIQTTGARCLFAEPQFSPALIDTLIEGSTAKIGVLDPLGATLTPGQQSYFTLIRNLADGFRDCLSAD